jgi:hypothetical protein
MASSCRWEKKIGEDDVKRVDGNKNRRLRSEAQNLPNCATHKFDTFRAQFRDIFAINGTESIK